MQGISSLLAGAFSAWLLRLFDLQVHAATLGVNAYKYRRRGSDGFWSAV